MKERKSGYNLADWLSINKGEIIVASIVAWFHLAPLQLKSVTRIGAIWLSNRATSGLILMLFDWLIIYLVVTRLLIQNAHNMWLRNLIYKQDKTGKNQCYAYQMYDNLISLSILAEKSRLFIWHGRQKDVTIVTHKLW